MQLEPNKYVKELTREKYKYGFTTDIHTDIIDRGLDENVVRLISAKKEPGHILRFLISTTRLYRIMPTLHVRKRVRRVLMM